MDEKKRSVTGGYPIGNFGICGQINSSGEFLSSVLVNPSKQGGWLERTQGGSLTVSEDKVALKTSNFGSIETDILFPTACVTVKDARLPDLAVSFTTFAPVVSENEFTTSLPLLISEITVLNSSDRDRKLNLAFQAGDTIDQLPISTEINPDIQRIWFGFVGADALAADAASASVTISAGGQTTIRFLYAFHDPNGYYTDKLPTVEDLVRHGVENHASMKKATQVFTSLLPSVGDPQLDRILRWYLPAAVYLTRITNSFVITMGYCELNQRDSFWTSWLHLPFWPSLERRMLEETGEAMRPDGKIPTTILPIIERDDDLDINCYFVLRAKRYWDFTKDKDFITKLWPSVVKAMDWLQTRDIDGDGLIEQQSYWADWKDVNGVVGRKHAPHFEFTWLGALRGCADMAEAIGDNEKASKYRSMASIADLQINKSVADGGLWNGQFYASIWYDGREDNHVQQDQLVGALWNLIPSDRVASIYEAMEPADTAWGVRETYPYRSPFSNEGGDYHNGGVWPFLCFMDATGRYMHGYPNEAEGIIRKVGHWDLEEFGDYTPHEYLHGETGENLGPTIQGWNADLFATFMWGALGLEIIDEHTIQLTPHIDRDVKTAIKIPAGLLWYERSGKTQTLTSECLCELTIRFGEFSKGQQTIIHEHKLAPHTRINLV